MSTRRLLLIWALLLAGIVCIAQQPSKAYWQSRDSNYNLAISGGAAFQGLGDIVSGSVGYWSAAHCYNSAYTGNTADVFDTATGTVETLITCSSGGVLNTGSPTALATTCATACSIKTLYDQSGAMACNGGVACDVTNATTANQPKLTLAAFNGKACPVFLGSSVQSLTSATTNLQTQPFTAVSMVERNGALSSFGTWIHSGNMSNFFTNAASTVGLFLGTEQDATASDNALHSVISLFNGPTNSTAVIDGSASVLGSPGTASPIGVVVIGTDGGNPFTGFMCETGIWPGLFNATQYGNINTKQAAFW